MTGLKPAHNGVESDWIVEFKTIRGFKRCYKENNNFQNKFQVVNIDDNPN